MGVYVCLHSLKTKKNIKKNSSKDLYCDVHCLLIPLCALLMILHYRRA